MQSQVHQSIQPSSSTNWFHCFCFDNLINPKKQQRFLHAFAIKFNLKLNRNLFASNILWFCKDVKKVQVEFMKLWKWSNKMWQIKIYKFLFSWKFSLYTAEKVHKISLAVKHEIKTFSLFFRCRKASEVSSSSSSSS